MQYKSQKIYIKNTQYDRRVKLTDEQREDIRYMRKEYGLSYNKLAKEFGVSKRCIQFVCNPEDEKKCRERFKELRKDGRYYDKEKNTEYVRNTITYKQDLYNKGKIKPI